MSALERIQQEVEQWFLTEPLLFTVYCSHRLTINPNMQCPLRSGQGRIEYNPPLVDQLSNTQLKAMLTVEMVRILLKHPYSRQPSGCSGIALKMASDMVISPAYNMAWAGLAHPDNFGLPVGQHFEWYAHRLSLMDISLEEGTSDEASDTDNADGATQTANGKQMDTGNTEDSGQDENPSTDGQDPEQTSTNDANRQKDGDASQDYTSLWEEDVFMNQELTNIINGTTHWGSLPGNMVQLIQKATEGKIDYRNALRAFRTSILSQKRHLTRMRPSRRFGFDQMGSRYEFTTRLLVAIDTSGSVGSNGLARFFRIITTFFKYGIQEIDVLMFDTMVQGKLMTLTEAKKNKQTFEVEGRGGTDFQVPIDYVTAHPDYDALIILTDGEAPMPKVPALLRTKILWVIDNAEYFYKRHYEAFRKTGRVCWMEL
ncbi:MAG: hypothetical protein IJX44_05290 [Bacteroidaceae bacterium]|nr:hypothetical protein [Bacteroidaceae bacterium]